MIQANTVSNRPYFYCSDEAGTPHDAARDWGTPGGTPEYRFTVLGFRSGILPQPRSSVPVLAEGCWPGPPPAPLFDSPLPFRWRTGGARTTRPRAQGSRPVAGDDEV